MSSVREFYMSKDRKADDKKPILVGVEKTATEGKTVRKATDKKAKMEVSRNETMKSDSLASGAAVVGEAASISSKIAGRRDHDPTPQEFSARKELRMKATGKPKDRPSGSTSGPSGSEKKSQTVKKAKKSNK
ncbi:unnamed protein product [Caenorhabditis nigoni]